MFCRRGHGCGFVRCGNQFMLNVSAEAASVGGGVLIRALEPLVGIEHMRRHRRTVRMVDLARGPGRLASALKIDRSLDGVDLGGAGPLWLGALARPEPGSHELHTN